MPWGKSAKNKYYKEKRSWWTIWTLLHLRHLGLTLFHLLVSDIIKLFLLKNIHCTKEMLTSHFTVVISIQRVLCVFPRHYSKTEKRRERGDVAGGGKMLTVLERKTVDLCTCAGRLDWGSNDSQLTKNKNIQTNYRYDNWPDAVLPFVI